LHLRDPRNLRFKSAAFGTTIGRHDLRMVRGWRPRLQQAAITALATRSPTLEVNRNPAPP